MRENSTPEVFFTFLKLGTTSFGGPIAHLGYFREEIVVRRRWVSDAAYSELVALCQFLPGPASSQVGFSLGLMRAGYRGGLAAWTGFTLPSALMMLAFACGVGSLAGAVGRGVLQGLELAAVAIVAQAVWGMARTLCPDGTRASIAGLAAILSSLGSSPAAQIGVMALGGAAGLLLCRAAAPQSVGGLGRPVSRRVGVIALGAYALLLGALPYLGKFSPIARLCDAFYRSGALVFGGGHVLLPLLRSVFVGPGWVTEERFLEGYGAAQAVPGPLFTFAAYLGAVAAPSPTRSIGACIGLVAIFLPGLLVTLGALPFWDRLRGRTGVRSGMQGVNAAVVGLLGAALYHPLCTSAIRSRGDAVLAVAGFVMLTAGRAPPVLVVILGALAGGLTS